MQKQNGVFTGVIATLALLIVGALGLGGWYFWRETRAQQQQLASLRATIEASANVAATIPATPQPINTPSPVVPTPVPQPMTTQLAVLPTAIATPTTEAATTVIATPTSARSTSAPTTATSPIVVGPLPEPLSNPDFATALVPSDKDALAEHPNLTRYTINARLDLVQRTIVGQQTIHLTNTEDQPLNELYLRLYVNAPHYNEGGIVVTDVQVDGQAAATQLEIDDTALKITLARPLARNATTDLSLRFTTTVPTSGGGYGIFNETDGVWALYNWHPELAVYEHGGWLLNPVTDQGDPTNTDVSNYALTFAAPAGFIPVSSGVETGQKTQADGVIAHEIVGALVRNMVLVGSDRFKVLTEQAGDTTVNSYYLPGDEQGGKATLATTVKALTLFGKDFAPYPYVEMDVTEVRLGGGAAGMEATGLVMIGSDYYDPSQDQMLAGLDSFVKGAKDVSVLDFTTAHEVAHQWWYGVVGSDAYREPWLDESLTNWSSAYYVDQTINRDAGLVARDLFIGFPYQQILAEHDERLDQPVDRFSEEAYGGIVYGKGALMYDVLRQQLGDQKFFAFIKRHYSQHQFGRTNGVDWRADLAAVSDQQTADAFYQKWVEGTSIRASDLPPGGPLQDMLGNLGDLGGLGGLDEMLPTATPGR